MKFDRLAVLLLLVLGVLTLGMGAYFLFFRPAMLPLVMDTVLRVPQTGDKGIALKQKLEDKLIEHKRYIEKNGRDMLEIRDWRWNARHRTIPAT